MGYQSFIDVLSIVYQWFIDVFVDVLFYHTYWIQKKPL